jgi:AraC-like DNA-binding protein
MAKLANMSPGHFANRYSDFFSVSPIDDLIDCRIRAAQRLLQQGQYNMAAIAERTGFSDVYYFNRTFKKRVGCPPGAYRKRFGSKPA